MSHHPVISGHHLSALMDPQPRGRWWALVLLGAAQFMLILDVTVINVALPTLSSEMGLNPALASWAITAYAIPFAALLLEKLRTTSAPEIRSLPGLRSS